MLCISVVPRPPSSLTQGLGTRLGVYVTIYIYVCMYKYIRCLHDDHIMYMYMDSSVNLKYNVHEHLHN